MNRGEIFAIVGFGSALGAVAGAMALGKHKKGVKQQPYAAIGAGVLATAAAAVFYKAPTCPVCPPGMTVGITPASQTPPISHGGYVAAVALASAVGAVAGAIAIGKQRPNKLLGQQPYAPIGGALAGAGLAAALYPGAQPCPPCVPVVAAPAPTPAPNADGFPQNPPIPR